jgi:hypothetical protein
VLSAARSEPVVSVWYRGTPAGVPNQDELAALRALGFTAVTWPASQAAGVAELRRQAAIVSLTVDVREPKPPLTIESALEPGMQVDVRVQSLPARLLAATVWRAIAHGARSIAFDAGAPSGAGVDDVNGQTPAWIAPVRAVARQVSANVRLFDQLASGAPVKFQSISGARGALDAVLFQTQRDWVIIATNTSAERAEGLTTLPRPVPYAPWGSILDGQVVAMRQDSAGTVWQLALEPGAARIYVTSKH